jgi:hypothetical protein
MSYLNGRMAGPLAGLPSGPLSGYGPSPAYPDFSGINDPNLVQIWALKNALANPGAATDADWFVPAAPPSFQKNAVPKVDPADRGALDAAILGFGQGATFGFANNLSSGLDATFAPIANWFLPQGSQRFTEPDWWSRYKDAMAVGRQLDQTAERFHPIAHGVGIVAGGLATVPIAPQATVLKGVEAAADAGRLARVGATASRVAAGAGNAAVTGGGYGGLYGFGLTEGDLWDRLVGAGKGALWGSGLGAAVGGPLHALAELFLPRVATGAALPEAENVGSIGHVNEPASEGPRSETSVAQPAEPIERANPTVSPELREAASRVLVDTGAPAERIPGASSAVPGGPGIITPAAPAIIRPRQPNLRTPDIPEPFDMPWLDLAGIPGVPQQVLPRLRYPSPSGMSPRMEDLLSSDKVYPGLVEAIQQGAAMGGAEWNYSLPIRGWLRDRFGPDAGDEAFRQFMGSFAAASPGTSAMQNARVGSYLYKLIRNDLPIPDYEQLQWPYGHPRNWLHEYLADNAMSGDWNSLDQPKTSSLYQNFIGNNEPGTIDSIIIRGVGTDGGFPNFQLGKRDYWALEQLLRRAGSETGLGPGPASQAARAGYLCRGGSCDSDGSRSLLFSIANRFPPTADELQLSEDQIRDLLLPGNISLYSLGALPIAAAASGLGQPTPAPGGSYPPDANQ